MGAGACFAAVDKTDSPATARGATNTKHRTIGDGAGGTTREIFLRRVFADNPSDASFVKALSTGAALALSRGLTCPETPA
jgi:hypothetical protein